LALLLQQLCIAHRGLGTRIRVGEYAILLERFVHVALALQCAGVQQMSHRRAEVRIETDELIERDACSGGITLGKLRLRESEHEVGIVLVEAGKCLAVLTDGVIEAPMPHQLLGVALSTGDVARNTRLAFVAAQVRTGINRAPKTARGALRGAAAEELGEDLDDD